MIIFAKIFISRLFAVEFSFYKNIIYNPLLNIRQNLNTIYQNYIWKWFNLSTSCLFMNLIQFHTVNPIGGGNILWPKFFSDWVLEGQNFQTFSINIWRPPYTLSKASNCRKKCIFCWIYCFFLVPPTLKVHPEAPRH